MPGRHRRPGLPESPGPLICADVQDVSGSADNPVLAPGLENPQGDKQTLPAPAQPERWWKNRLWPENSSTVALPLLLIPPAGTPAREAVRLVKAVMS